MLTPALILTAILGTLAFRHRATVYGEEYPGSVYWDDWDVPDALRVQPPVVVTL